MEKKAPISVVLREFRKKSSSPDVSEDSLSCDCDVDRDEKYEETHLLSNKIRKIMTGRPLMARKLLL